MGTVARVLLSELDYRIAGSRWPGRYGGMIEVDQFIAKWKFRMFHG